MTRLPVVWSMIAAAALLAGCSKESETADEAGSEMQPRQRGEFADAGGRGAATQPGPTAGPLSEGAAMPHDAIHAPFHATGTQPAGTRPAGTMPNDAIHAGMRPGEDIAPQFTAPPEWQARPARFMTDQIFALPRAEGDPEDGDLAISSLPRHVTLDMNINRWCLQFGYQGEECRKATKQRKLEGTKFPTAIVDISGTYQPGAMMGPAVEPKEGYRMLAAEIIAPQRRWYVKLVGPEKTVAKWEEAFTRFVSEAK
jgi:hypothetical protein